MINFLKTFIFTLLLCLVAGFTVYGQSIEWIKSIPIKEEQGCYTICPTENKGFWLGGATNNGAYIYNSFRRPKMAVIAVDSLGDTLWQKNYFNTYRIGIITKIVPAPAGKYLIGYYSHDTTTTTGWRRRPLLMYVDNSGEIIWRQDHLMADCANLFVFDAKVMQNGDIVIIGYYQVINPASCTQNIISFAIRVNPDGEKLWDKMYDYSGTNYINRISEFPNGNLLCSGISNNNGIMGLEINAVTGDLLQVNHIKPSNLNVPFQQGYLQLLTDGSMMATGNTLSGIAYIARLDANMNKLWEKLGGFRNRQVYEMPNGHLLLESYDNNRVLHISKLSIANGDTLWKMKLGTPIVYNDFGNVIAGQQYDMTGGAIFDGKGNASIAGIFRNDDTPQPVYTAENFFTAKLKDVGIPLTNFCQQGPQANFAGALVSDTLKLNSTSFSNVTFHDTLQYQWFVGGVALNTGNQTLQQTVNVSAYPQGVPVKLVITNHWGCKDSLTAVVTATGVVGNRPFVETLHATSLRNARPNPSTQNVTIGYNLPANTKEAVLRVYELGTGRTVAERSLSALEADTKFNVSHWATGVYAYQLFINGTPVAVKQLVVTR